MPLQVQDNDKSGLEVNGSVRAQIRVKNNYKIRREVHRSATARSRQSQNYIRGSWQCQCTVKG